MISELKKIAAIENIVDRKLYFMSILTRACMEKGIQPVVVGGSAVEFYTEGFYPSYDIDLVGSRKIIGEILEKNFGFKTSGRHWINEQIGLYIEIPSSYLKGDKTKITTIKIGNGNLPVYVLGIEDLILDRLRACVHWQSQTDCEQARFLLQFYQNRIDFKYLEKKAKDEGELRVLKRLIEGNPIWKKTARGIALWYKKS